MLHDFDNIDVTKIAEGSIKGGGSYATVYEGINPETVIKRGRAINDGWLIWALYCMTLTSYDHPSLPKIHLLHVDFANMHFTALMERLDPVDYGWARPQAQGRHSQSDEIDYLSLGADMGLLTRVHLDRCLTMFLMPEVDVRIDMHADNMMHRNGTHVINDPFSYLHTLDSSGWNGEISRDGDNIKNLYKRTTMPKGLTYNE